MRWLRFFVAALLVTAGAIVSVASPASADAPTVCSSTQPVTGDVSGDVVVPADSYCILGAIAVHGTVTVGAISSLFLYGTRIGGNVLIGWQGELISNWTASIAGDVTLDYAFLVELLHGTVVGGDVRGTLRQQDQVAECDFDVGDSVVQGDLDVTTSGILRYVCIDNATIDGDLNLANSVLYISNSAVGGNTTFTAVRSDRLAHVPNGFAPSEICATTFGGNLTLRDSLGVVLLGGGGSCRDARLDVRGSLLINDNRNWVHVSAHVHGNVVCRRNTHHPIAGHPTSRHLQNIVNGHLVGQCAFLAVRQP